MKSYLLAAIIFVLLPLITNAQTEIIVPGYVQLPEDSLLSKKLISSLTYFLNEAEEKNTENKSILPSQKVETFILLDEFRGAEKSRSSDHFFKPYLNNVIELNNDKYLIQLSHIGVKDSTPYLRSVFNLIAHYQGNSFLFSSPLKENTKTWKSTTIDHFTFNYEDTLNYKNAMDYVTLSKKFDTKLNSTNKTTKIYCTNSRTELLSIIGVDYKLDYNGRTSGVFSASNGDEQLIVLGNNNKQFNTFDPHDLWHDRLSLVIPRREVNKPVDEGCAYLYGGSWGISWNEIFNRFVKEVASDKDADWIYYKENKTNFGESQEEHLMVDYVVNALIIQKIEEKVGFSGVWKLLNCGSFTEGNENYYSALNETIGISKKNYNKEVWKLIKQEKLNI